MFRAVHLLFLLPFSMGWNASLPLPTPEQDPDLCGVTSMDYRTLCDPDRLLSDKQRYRLSLVFANFHGHTRTLHPHYCVMEGVSFGLVLVSELTDGTWDRFEEETFDNWVSIDDTCNKRMLLMYNQDTKSARILTTKQAGPLAFQNGVREIMKRNEKKLKNLKALEETLTELVQEVTVAFKESSPARKTFEVPEDKGDALPFVVTLAMLVSLACFTFACCICFCMRKMQALCCKCCTDQTEDESYDPDLPPMKMSVSTSKPIKQNNYILRKNSAVYAKEGREAMDMQARGLDLSEDMKIGGQPQSSEEILRDPEGFASIQMGTAS